MKPVIKESILILRQQINLLLVLSLMAMTVQADSDTLDADQVNGLPTIIITLDWREIDLQHAPSTVNMLSSQKLDTGNIKSTQDLQYHIPGLVFTSSSGVGKPYLRGVGGTVSAAGDSGVATFVDGVYQTRAAQSLRDFFDIKRVEVIKGPHSVHLGRNVVGGAISITTEDPEPYQEAYADVLYGKSNQRQFRGAFNIPLSDNGLSFRLAGTMIKRDGYSQNIFLDEDLDDQDYYAWRGKLRYHPSKKLDIIFSAEQSRQDDARGLAKQPNPDVGINGGILLGGIVPDDPRKVTYNKEQNQNIHNDLYSAKVIWNTGNTKVQSITAYQTTDLDLKYELDGTNVDFSSDSPASNSKAFSQELRIESQYNQVLSWVTGVFFLHEDASQELNVRLPLFGVENNPDSSTENSAFAVFGEIAYQFMPKWQARIGLRYNYDESKIDLQQTIIDPFGVFGSAGTSTIRYKAQDDWQAVTPEFGLTYSTNSRIFYYANASRGFKSGGFNAYAVQPAFDPEYLWSYELGVKTTLPGDKVRINAALFYYDYTDMQILTLPPDSPANTLPIVTNAASATIQGLDFQVWYRPLWNLELTAGATLLDAHFDKFNSVDPNNPTSSPDRSGDTLPQAPEVSLLLGSEYQWTFPEHGDLSMSIDYRYQSAIYFNSYQDRAVRQGAYSLINANLSYSSHKGNWYAELYGNNLTDELYAQNIIRIDPVIGTARFWGEPRTYGFRLGYRM
ncbi:MAG: TonB-dependent receptor plug domain-containing protein [Gammaproteobacteria bacterium]|nr:TonB-dependent receptor plug domain-containing protein [Gammaproteobacteria bacterium]